MRRVIFPLLIGLGGAAVLVTLGLWQLDRLAWKEGILADMDARLTGAPTALPERPTEAEDRYRPVTASGTTGGRELHVLVSDKRLGAGFRVVTAFETETGRRILLDRGFIPDRAKTDPRPPGPVTVTGNLHWPDERDGFTPDNDVTGNFWFARDLAQMAAELGTEPILIVARDVAPATDLPRPMPVTTEGIPNNHLGYAIQWFGMALVWLGMTALFIRRITRPGARETRAA